MTYGVKMKVEKISDLPYENEWGELQALTQTVPNLHRQECYLPHL